MVKASGISKANLHYLRHTFAAGGIEQGIPLKLMQDLIGHGDITTTSKYAHALDDAKREAMIKMESVFQQSNAAKTGSAT